MSCTQGDQFSEGRQPHAGTVADCDSGRLLVVDDDEGILALFRAILTSAFADRRIDAARNGAEALASFSAARHGLLLMDLHMPVMDGYAAFCRIEDLCATRNWRMPSVVFCTGFAPPATLHRILSATARHALLCKPVSADHLVAVIRSRLTA